MKWYHKKRMQKLIDYLRQLDRKEFNFGILINECGSVGCAMGHTPYIWPKLVKYISWNHINYNNISLIKKTGSPSGYVNVAKELFGLTYQEALALFAPNHQYILNLPNLKENATPKQVAKNLEKFLKVMEKSPI